MQSHRNSVKRRPTGIEQRHRRSCGAPEGRKCSCKPTWRAFVYSKRDGRKIRRTFATLAEAKAWRADALGEIRRGSMRAPARTTLRQTANEWLEAAQAGTIRNRNGEPYKPSVLRSYEDSLRLHVLPELGGARLSEIRRVDIQDLVDRLCARGLAAQTVRNTINALRPIFGRAVRRGDLAANPTKELDLPSGGNTRDRIASADEAARLIVALPERDRPLWACAFYGGLRAGELRALRWSHVDLASGVIHVRDGWDDKEGRIDPKSRKGTRDVPIPAVLRDHLIEYRARSTSDGFVFATHTGRPFSRANVRKRALAAWERAEQRRRETIADVGAELTEAQARADERAARIARTRIHEAGPPYVPISLHSARHTYVSLMHDAGLSLERIGDYVGHSSSYMTDRYRHLLPDHLDEARRIADEYLARAGTAARVEQLTT